MAHESPRIEYSLRGFCDEAGNILEGDAQTPGDDAAFVQFVVCGIHADGQAHVDPMLDRLQELEDISIHRDFDSVLGVCEHILVTQDLSLYPVARKQDVLQKNIHLSYHFTSSSVRHYSYLMLNSADVLFW